MAATSGAMGVPSEALDHYHVARPHDAEQTASSSAEVGARPDVPVRVVEQQSHHRPQQEPDRHLPRHRFLASRDVDPATLPPSSSMSPARRRGGPKRRAGVEAMAASAARTETGLAL